MPHNRSMPHLSMAVSFHMYLPAGLASSTLGCRDCRRCCTASAAEMPFVGLGCRRQLRSELFQLSLCTVPFLARFAVRHGPTESDRKRYLSQIGRKPSARSRRVLSPRRSFWVSYSAPFGIVT